MIDDLLVTEDEWKNNEILISNYRSMTGKTRKELMFDWTDSWDEYSDDSLSGWLYKRIKQMEKQDKIKELLE